MNSKNEKLILLNCREASEFLNGIKSPWSLYQLAKRGKVPHIKIGKNLYFSKQGLENWICGLEAESVEKMAK